MIQSFFCKETQKLFVGLSSRKLPHDIQRIALRKLYMLDAAENIQDLKVPPSNFLEKLQGNRKNQYSIRINDQWRLCFTWSDNHAHDVEIIDYH